MANCPHCGRKLRLFDWRPECPDCKTNLIYYNSNQRLLDESEKAEKEHAAFQPKIDRAKAAYAGSPLAIVRIILTLLPIGALFLPLLTIVEGGKQLNVIDVYKIMNAYGIGNVFGDALKKPICLSAVFLLISAVMIIVSLVLILMSLGKHAKIRVLITYSFMVLCAVTSAVIASVAGKQSMELIEGINSPFKPGVGLYLYIALLAVLLIFNLFLLKAGIPVKYTQCLIGGLPSDEYYRYIEQGMSKADLQRKMLIALAELEYEQEIDLQEETKGDEGK